MQIEGPNPCPLKQYRCPEEDAESLKVTTEALVQQNVLIVVESPCNSPIWPVMKADKKTWHLTVDYRELNWVIPQLAPVVAKFIDIMAAITAGAKSFSVIDLSMPSSVYQCTKSPNISSFSLSGDIN